MRDRRGLAGRHLRPGAMLAGACLLLAAWGAVVAKDRKPRDADDLAEVRSFDVAVRAGVALVGQTAGVELIDVRDPMRPRELSRIRLHETVLGVVLDGDLAYLAAGSLGLLIFDIADAENPTFLHRIDTPGSVHDVAVRGTVAIVADDIQGIRVIDLSRTDDPRVRATVSTRSSVRAVHWVGDLLATAEGGAGVRLFDVRRPDNPRELVVRSDIRNARDVLLAADRLYVAEGHEGVGIYDIDVRRRRIDEVARVAPLSSAGALALGGELLAICNGGSGVQLVRPGAGDESPVLATFELPHGLPAGKGRIDGNRMYLAVDIGGLAIVDVSDPVLPEVLVPRKRSFSVTFR